MSKKKQTYVIHLSIDLQAGEVAEMVKVAKATKIVQDEASDEEAVKAMLNVYGRSAVHLRST